MLASSPVVVSRHSAIRVIFFVCLVLLAYLSASRKLLQVVTLVALVIASFTAAVCHGGGERRLCVRKEKRKERKERRSKE